MVQTVSVIPVIVARLSNEYIHNDFIGGVAYSIGVDFRAS